MAENVGGIVWTAEMKTEQLVGAEKTITNTLNKTDQAFAKTSKASDQLNTRYTKTAQGVSNATKGMSRNFGMAGVQVQQFVGQIQGGQSALLALSQQGADLGIVLGAAGLGAAVGIAATALSFLLPLLTTASADVEELKKRIEELGDSTVKTVNQIRFLATENSKSADALSKDNEKIAKSIKEKQDELEKMISAGTGLDEGQFAIPRSAEQNQAKYAKKIQKTKQELEALRATIDTNNQGIIKLNEDTQKLTETDDKLVKKTNDISDALARQIIALDLGEKAAMQYAIAQQLQLKAGEKIPADIQAQIDKIFELKAAQSAQAEQEKKNAEMARDMAAFRKKSANEELAAANKLKSDKSSAASFAQGIVDDGMSEEDRLTAEMDKLDQLHQQGLLDYQLYQDAKVAIAEQANALIEKSNDDLAQSENLSRMALLSSAGSMFGELAQLTKEFGGEQSNSYKALFAISKGFAVANAALNLNSAILQVMADPTALTPAQKFANYAAIAGAGGSLISSIAGINYGAGRLNGGPVYPGMMHPVTEDGRPELLIQGGQQYLLPGSRGGEVISNKDMNKAGGNQPNVNVNIITPQGMSADVQTKSSSQGIDINATISAVADNIMNGGKVYSAMQKTTKSKSRTG